MMKIPMKTIVGVLWQGSSVKNPTRWKAFNLVVTLVSLGLLILSTWAWNQGWLPEGLSINDAFTIATSFIMLVLSALGLTQVAAEKDLGLPRKQEDLPPPSANGPSDKVPAAPVPDRVSESGPAPAPERVQLSARSPDVQRPAVQAGAGRTEQGAAEKQPDEDSVFERAFGNFDQ